MIFSRKTSRSIALVELAVIVVVLCIFGSIFRVSSKMMTAKLQQAQCVGNLKHLIGGWQKYVQDNDGILPPTRIKIASTGKSWEDYAVWTTLMQNYFDDPMLLKTKPEKSNIRLTDGGVFHCPVKNAAPSGLEPHYGMNTIFGDGKDSWHRIKDISLPGQTLVFVDIESSYVSGAVWWANRYVSYRHSQGSNCAFADGHCEWLPKQVLFVPEGSRWEGRPPWQPKIGEQSTE
jgi:prepilin-type processing-associated H-X9-DG protein